MPTTLLRAPSPEFSGLPTALLVTSFICVFFFDRDRMTNNILILSTARSLHAVSEVKTSIECDILQQSKGKTTVFIY